MLGGGTIGLMLARLLVLDGRDVLVCDRHPERRAQAEAFGARAADALGEHDLVFEAVGRVEAWEQAVAATRPGGTAVLVGGCPGGTTVRARHRATALRRGRRARRLSPHARRGRPRAGAAGRRRRRLATRSRGDVVGLEDLAGALQAPTAGEARKLVVDPSR